MSSSASRLAAALVVLALALAGTAPVAGQSAAESTSMQVALQPDGDARWTVSTRFALEDGNETAAFRRLADEYVAGETDVLSADPYREAAALASQATGRAMAVRAVDRTASQANATGELRLSFTWTNFTRRAEGGDRLVLGDVFRTPAGTWLPRLGEGQVLVIEFPEAYVVQSTSRPLDNGSIRVTGPATFEPGEPSATLERGEQVASPSPPGQGIGVPSGLAAGGVLALLLAVAYVLYRRREGAEADEAPAGGAADDEPAEPADEALLSDEERVLRLLRAEGGRMKQVDIVEETDWSNAKVSQLLSSMADEGRIEKLRIGRENLISLPDEDD